MVYVLDKNGQPLMPTDRHRKVRLMLQSGQAKVIKRCPFTIQLNYDSGHQTPVSYTHLDVYKRQGYHPGLLLLSWVFYYNKRHNRNSTDKAEISGFYQYRSGCVYLFLVRPIQ